MNISGATYFFLFWLILVANCVFTSDSQKPSDYADLKDSEIARHVAIETKAQAILDETMEHFEMSSEKSKTETAELSNQVYEETMRYEFLADEVIAESKEALYNTRISDLKALYSGLGEE